MTIVKNEKYRDTLQPQPWHSKLEEAKIFFESRYHQDITSQEGFNAVMSHEGWRDQYNEMSISALVNDERMCKVLQDVSRHSMEDVKNPFAISTEATDTLANNANYSALAKLNSWIIVGYTARSKCLELYNTFSSDDPTVSFKYNISYIKRANDPEEYIRPNADRDGDIGPLYDLPIIAPSDELVGEAGFEHLKSISGESANGVNDVWIRIKGGVMGNIFDDNKGKFNANHYTLEKNPMIVGVYYDLTDIDADAVPLKGMIKTYSERDENTGAAKETLLCAYNYSL